MELTLAFTIVRVLLGLLLNAFIILNALLWQKMFFNLGYRLHEKIAVIAILVWTQIVVILLGLHFFHAITFRYALLSSFLISVITYWLARRLQVHLFAFDISQLMVCKHWSRFEQASLLTGIATIIVLAGINLIAPPANWDSLNYQLFLPVNWYQQHHLALVPIPFGDVAPSYYPINANLIFLWLILPFDSIAVADIGQSPFALLTAIGVYFIARQFDLPPIVARRSAILTLFVPMITATAGLWSTNDVMFATGWLLGLATMQRAVRTATLRDLILASIAVGLTAGTKSFALAFCTLIAPWIVIAIWHYAAGSWVRLLTGAIIAFSLIVFLGSFTYIRNWIITGNPLYPYRFIVGAIVWPGVVDWHWFSQHQYYEFNWQTLLIEPGYINVGLLSLLAVPATAIVLSQIKRWSVSIAIMIILVLCYLVIFGNFLPIRAPRFLIPAILLLLIIFVLSIEQLPIIEKLKNNIYIFIVFTGSMQIFLITSLSMGTNLFQPSPVSLHLDMHGGKVLFDFAQQVPLWTAIQYVFLLGSVSGFLYWLLRLAVQRPRLSFALASATIVTTLALGLEQYDRLEYFAYKREHYAGLGQLWRWVNEHTSSQRIAYLGGEVPLPLAGHHLKNRVTAINVGQGYLLHEIESAIPPTQPIATYPDHRSDIPNREQWLNNLQEYQIDFVVVYDRHKLNWPEVQWMQRNPDQFKLVYSGPGGSVWRFRR